MQVRPPAGWSEDGSTRGSSSIVSVLAGLSQRSHSLGSAEEWERTVQWMVDTQRVDGQRLENTDTLSILRNMNVNHSPPLLSTPHSSLLPTF